MKEKSNIAVTIIIICLVVMVMVGILNTYMISQLRVQQEKTDTVTTKITTDNFLYETFPVAGQTKNIIKITDLKNGVICYSFSDNISCVIPEY